MKTSSSSHGPWRCLPRASAARVTSGLRPWGIAGAIVAILLLGAVLLHSFLESRLSNRALDSQLSSILHLTVRTRSIQLAWNGVVSLEDVRMREGPQDRVTVPTADIHFAFWDLLRGQLTIRAIVLKDPVIAITTGNLADWSSRLQAMQRDIPLRILRGRATIHTASGRPVRLEGVSGGITLASDGLTYDATFVDEAGGHYRLGGRMSGPEVAFEASMAQPSLASLGALWQIPSSPALDGAADLRVTLRGRLPTLSVDGLVTLTGPLASLAPHVHGILKLASDPSFEGTVEASAGTIPGVGRIVSLQVPLTVSSRACRLAQAVLATEAGVLT